MILKKNMKENMQKSPISCGIMYNRNLLLQYGDIIDFRHKEEEELRRD